MIVQLILELFYSVIALLLTPVQFVLSPIGSMAGLIELLMYASIFIPLGTLSWCIAAWVSFYGFKFVMTTINWIIAKFPTIE